MNLKLYVWNCDIWNTRRISLSAMAENVVQAKQLILASIKNQQYKEEAENFFQTTARPPVVYDKPEAFINHEGVHFVV